MKFCKMKLQQIAEKNINYNSRKVKSTLDIVQFINSFEELDKLAEEITLQICLNNKNQIIAYTEIAKGRINSCNVDIKTIFKTVLICNASKFIIVHNHPGGDVEVSEKDIEVTEHIKKAATIMNIDFVDHIIIADKKYKSCMFEKKVKELKKEWMEKKF